MPCYYGTMLTSESEKLRDYVYGSNWVDQSKRFKTSFNIIQQRTMQLIVPTTYKGTILIGLETFVAVNIMKIEYFVGVKFYFISFVTDL